MFLSFFPFLRPQLASEEPNPPPAPPPPPQPEHVRYERILWPTWDELRYAAHVWDQIASMNNIRYAFIGTFAAILRGQMCEIHDIEIVVEPSARDNYAERLTEIARTYPQQLAITRFNHHIVVVRENKGIAFQCASLGSPGYPDEFIEPYDSWLRPPEQFNLAPTFNRESLGYTVNDRAVPIFVSRLLLFQRLYRFNPNTLDEHKKERNIRDIDDIKAFLILACQDQEPPFDVPWLLPLVRDWIRFADNNFVGTTALEVLMWNRMGIPLTAQDVSVLLR